MASGAPGAHAAWNDFVDGLRAAGDQLAEDTTGLDPAQRADAFRALLRGVGNQLGRFEVDRDRPELVAFNGWRQKMLMDNPDFRYWVADIRDDRRYRITGSIGDAVYQSVTVYSSTGGLSASADARIDSDSITFDDDGCFELTVAREAPPDGSGWLALPEGATSLWVRQFQRDAASERLGWCRIDPIDDPPPSRMIDEQRFLRHLTRLGTGVSMLPAVWSAAVRDDLEGPNTVRRWTEMAAGAAFTEPDVHYLRGSWQLDDDDALVIEGNAPPCRYWNVLLYSRFLNSLDYRSRSVSRTDSTAHVVDGRYRFVISATDPGTGSDWLDTEGRPLGLFVFRFLQPATAPDLPRVRRCGITEVTES